MKRSLWLPLFAMLLALNLRAAGELPQPEIVRLANGVTVFIHPDSDLPLVSFRLLIQGAGTAAPLAGEGVADLTAALLLKGTATRPAAQLAEEIDFLGARLTSGTAEEYYEMYGGVLSENFPALLALAAECLAAPALSEEEFAKEQQRRLETVKAIKDDPAEAVQPYFRKAYFGLHPWGKLDIGGQGSLTRMSVEDVRRFHGEYLRPERAIMAVVGDVKPEAIKKLLADTLGKWQAAGQPPEPVPPPPLPVPKGKSCLLIDKPDATQAYFILGVPGLAMGDKLTADSQVMNTLFGGRFTSWLNTELRIKRGLTYGAHSGFESWRPGGLFTVASYTKNDKIGEMLGITFDLIEKARGAGFSAKEVESARNYILGQFPLTLETLAAKTRAYVQLYFYGLGFTYYGDLLKRINAMKLPEVNALAKQVMPAGDFILVVVGKAGEIRQQLAKFGQFTERKISEPDF